MLAAFFTKLKNTNLNIKYKITKKLIKKFDHRILINEIFLILEFHTKFENMSAQNFFIAYLWAKHIIPILQIEYDIPRHFARLSSISLKLVIGS